MGTIDYGEIYEEFAARLEFMEGFTRSEAEVRATHYVRELRTNNLKKDKEQWTHNNSKT